MSTDSPVRCCVVCRTRRPQRALLRIVRTPTGVICLDRGPHRGAGRGAYVCPTAACVSKARKAIPRALGGTLPDEVDRALRDAAAEASTASGTAEDGSPRR